MNLVFLPKKGDITEVAGQELDLGVGGSDPGVRSALRLPVEHDGNDEYRRMFALTEDDIGHRGGNEMMRVRPRTRSRGIQ
jgi:hypothetical protein